MDLKVIEAIFDHLPDILKLVPVELRIGALSLLAVLAVLWLILGVVRNLHGPDLPDIIRMIIRYSFITVALICVPSFGYAIISGKSEIDELSSGYLKQQPISQPSSERDFSLVAPQKSIDDLNQSLVILSRGFDPPPGTAEALAQLKKGNPLPAIAVLAQVAPRQKDRERAKTLREIGLLAFYKDTQIALKAYQESAELDPDNADAWSQIGLLLERAGDHEGARTAARKAIEIGNRQNDANALAAGYSVLGVIDANAGRAESAETYLQKARGFYLTMGSKADYARLTNELARVQFVNGEYAAATRYYEEALSSDTAANNKHGMAADYIGLGQIIAEDEEPDFAKALNYYDKALAIAETADDLHEIAFSLSSKAAIYKKRRGPGDLDNALANIQRAQMLEHKLGNRLAEAYAMGSLGDLARIKKDYNEAELQYIQGLRIAGDVSPLAEAVLRRGLGRVYLEQKKAALALAAFDRALAIDRELRKEKYVAVDQSWAGVASLSLGRTADACSSWSEAEAIYQKTEGAEDELADLRANAAKAGCTR
jgi:tetratricopeptide (TPR) repeat protein